MSKELEYFDDHDLEFNQVLASHHGRGKAFDLSVKQDHTGYLYTVSAFGVTVYKGRDSKAAVDVYNDLDH